MYPGDMVEMFVDPFKAAYAALAPGETVKQPVRTTFGWHVIKKEAASDDDLAAAYKKAKAPELAKKLADEILARMRTADSTRAAVAGAVESVLGDDAKESADRPHEKTVLDAHVDALHLEADAKTALAQLAKTGRAGEVSAAPIASKGAFVAARVASAPPR
jgi:parvulin-like peptidyl-prolyl isomerase